MPEQTRIGLREVRALGPGEEVWDAAVLIGKGLARPHLGRGRYNRWCAA